MATTKQYNDLQDGGNIQTGDKLAVARAGASELLTVPAESLAQRAAEIVSTDQMQEFVADLGLGKQVLAQALNNKGAGVTAADTLAQMAGKVDALDVVGAKEYLYSKWQYFSYANSVGIPSPDIEGYSISLPYKDVVLTVNCTNKSITTRRIVGDDTSWTEMDTVEDSDIGTYILYIVPNKDHSAVAIVSYSSAESNKILVYSVDDNGTLSKKGITITTSYSTSSTSYSFVFLNPDATYVYVSLSSSSSNRTMYKYDVNTGEETNITFNNAIANCLFFTMTSDDTAIAISNLAESVAVYRITFSGSEASVSSYSLFGSIQGRGYGVYVFSKHNVIATWSVYTSSSTKIKVCNIYNLETGNLIKSLQTRNLTFTDNSTSASYYANYSLSGFRFDDNIYYLFDAYKGIIKYNPDTEELELDNGTNSTYENLPISGILVFNYNSSSSYYGANACFSTTYISKNKKMFSYGGEGTISLSPIKWSNYSYRFACLFKDDTPVVGEEYSRNGNLTSFLIAYFNMDKYEAGAYDLENSSAVVQLSGEADQ